MAGKIFRRLFVPIFGIGIVAAVAFRFFSPVQVAIEYGIHMPSNLLSSGADNYSAAYRAFRIKPVALCLDFIADQNVEENPTKYPLAAKTAWVKDNESGFALFEKAQKTPFYYPPSVLPEDHSKLPFELRRLANCLEVRNQVLAQNGQAGKAVEGALDIWEMGLRTSLHAPLTPAMGCLAVEIYARRSLNDEIAHLTGPEAAHAAKRLENLLTSRNSFQAVLTQEREDTLLSIPKMRDEAIRDADQTAQFEASLKRGESNFQFDSSPAPQHRSPTDNFILRRMCSEYSAGMNQLIAKADTPWPNRDITIPDLGQTRPMVPKLLDVTANSRFFFARSDTMGQIFLTRLALLAYRKDTGAYPHSLKDLVPRYLTSVPKDPFAATQELKYRLKGPRYQLWSVGPDAHDDDAKPAENQVAAHPSSRYLVGPNSQGDIVANISR